MCSCAAATLSSAGSFNFIGRPFVKRFALFCRSVVCLSVLSVTLVYCGQTIGRIKMKLGTQIGLGPGHIVLDGDPAPLPQKGAEPPNFRLIFVVAKWLDGPNHQDATWHGGRSWPRPHPARWGPSCTHQRGRSPQFSVHICCGQMAGSEQGNGSVRVTHDSSDP